MTRATLNATGIAVLDVLIIEDEEALREAIVEGLTAALPDFTMAGVGSVEDAMVVIRESPPILIVSDVRLPGKSGVDFLIEAREKWPSIKFILISAFASVSNEQALAHGALRLLRKPFALKELVSAVESALQNENFHGSVEEISLLDLMQVLHWGKKTSVIFIRRGARRGEIFFEHGEIVHAKASDLRGIEALYAMMRWQGGSFQAKAGQEPPRRTIEASFDSLILEAMRLIDEEARDSDATTHDDLIIPASLKDSVAEEKNTTQKEGKKMAKVNLEVLEEIDGFLGACLVDSDSGMVLGLQGGGPIDLEVAAAGNTQVVRAKRKTMSSLGLADTIEDMLISLNKQYHILRPLESNQALFLYLVLDRAKANLAMARHEIKTFEKGLEL